MQVLPPPGAAGFTPPAFLRDCVRRALFSFLMCCFCSWFRFSSLGFCLRWLQMGLRGGRLSGWGTHAEIDGPTFYIGLRLIVALRPVAPSKALANQLTVSTIDPAILRKHRTFRITNPKLSSDPSLQSAFTSQVPGCILNSVHH